MNFASNPKRFVLSVKFKPRKRKKTYNKKVKSSSLMSLDVQQSLQENLRMNADFWPRGPNTASNFQPLMDSSNEYHMQRNVSHIQTSGFHNNNNNDNGVVDLKDHLITGQENQNNFNQSTSGFQLNQQQPVASPSAENSSPESKFNSEKFANDVQVSFQFHLELFSGLVKITEFWRETLTLRMSKIVEFVKKIDKFYFSLGRNYFPLNRFTPNRWTGRFNYVDFFSYFFLVDEQFCACLMYTVFLP